MKTSDLIGPSLDWAVAKCDQPQWSDEDALLWVQDDDYQYSPSTDWAQGGPIIERERIELSSYADQWQATAHLEDGSIFQRGPTPLIAAMRCYLVSKLGDEVEVPEDLK